MNNRKPYLEGFFSVRELADRIEIMPITNWQYRFLEHNCAEINVIYDTESAGYTAVFMLVDRPPDYIAVMEIFILQNDMPQLIRDFPDHFAVPDWFQ